MPQALTNINILEHCNLISGPYCAKLLADLGAEVIKIERPKVGDSARKRGPFPDNIPHPEQSGLFLYLNTNKLGVTLNLETACGRRVFTQLVKRADILVEDNPPGTMEGLKLGYEVLRDLNPSLIVTSITPYGQTGPYRGYKAQHLNLYHASGQAQFCYSEKRRPGQAPVQGGGHVGDYDAGLGAAVATLAALYKRYLCGTGQHIDISKQETLISLDRVDVGTFATDRAAASKRKGLLGGLVPCKDGYVVVITPEQHQWEALVKLLGNPEWANYEKCKDEFTRSENMADLQPLIEEWALQHTKQEIYQLGQSLGCPVSPVNSAADVFNSPQAQERGFFVDIEHPLAGKLSYPSAPYKFSRTPWQAKRAAPLLGEHNKEVYCGLLGHSATELSEMEELGVV